MMISHDPKPIMKRLQEIDKVKPDSIGPPKRYLGADIGNFQIPGDNSGHEYWYMSARSYVTEDIRNLKIVLEQENRTLKTNVKNLSLMVTNQR